jgi:hypothetical protein
VVHILIILDAVSPSTDLGDFVFDISKDPQGYHYGDGNSDPRWFLCSSYKNGVRVFVVT